MTTSEQLYFPSGKEAAILRESLGDLPQILGQGDEDAETQKFRKVYADTLRELLDSTLSVAVSEANGIRISSKVLQEEEKSSTAASDAKHAVSGLLLNLGLRLLDQARREAAEKLAIPFARLDLVPFYKLNLPTTDEIRSLAKLALMLRLAAVKRAAREKLGAEDLRELMMPDGVDHTAARETAVYRAAYAHDLTELAGPLQIGDK